MSTITVILEPDADGTVHLTLPPELRRGKVRVTATAQPVRADPKKFKGTLLEAFEELRKVGGLDEIIPDPVAWQREQRVDRPLPGRD